MSAAYQMVRIDAESRANLPPEVEEAVATAIKANLPSADVVIVSDYAKELCNDRVIRLSSRRRSWPARPRSSTRSGATSRSIETRR